MTINTVEQQEIQWLTKGNDAAGDFLRLWRAYVHAIDDIVDGDTPGNEALLGTFAMAIAVYTHPFFLANIPALRQIAVNCTNAYADSVAWEKAEGWKRDFSDHYRHFGAEMVLAVAGICGGYAHMRAVSPVLRELCWTEHHDEKGQAV